jgi:hypothetical protein
MSDGYERAGTIGFRCIADADADAICGNLCGRLDLDVNDTSAVDLTKLGTEDWLAFAKGGKLERKALGTGQPRRLVGISSDDSHQTAAATGGPALFWSDGQAPAKVGKAERSGVGSTSGFSLIAHATPEPSVLTVFLGSANVALNLSAHLSGGSSPDYTAPFLLGPAASQAGLEPVSTAMQFTFSSPVPDTNLIVRWSRARDTCEACYGASCLCAESGEQTPIIAGLANLTGEASHGGNWITVQTSRTKKNSLVIYSKAVGATIPIRLRFIQNGTVSDNMTALFGSYGLRIYGPGSPLTVAFSDGPSIDPMFSSGSGAFIAKLGQGFVISAAGDEATTRRLIFYGGCCDSTCRMEASMSEAGSDAAIDSTTSARAAAPQPLVREVVSIGGSQPHKFVIVYRGKGTLTVKYFCVGHEGEGECNLTFQGASVRVDPMGTMLLAGATLASLKIDARAEPDAADAVLDVMPAPPVKSDDASAPALSRALLLVAASTIMAQPPPRAQFRLPRWKPTYSPFWRSTIVMPCNTSGVSAEGVEQATRYGVAMLDSSNAKDEWANARPMSAQELLTKQAELVLAAEPGIPGEQPRVWVYRNQIKALNFFSSVREKVDDPDYAGWFVHFKGYEGAASNHSYGKMAPACTFAKCSPLWHDQYQTPCSFHPSPLGAPGDGSCAAECDCGAT